MDKKKKFNLLALGFVIGLIAIWYVYQISTAKRIDPNTMDGRLVAQEYLKSIEKYKHLEK